MRKKTATLSRRPKKYKLLTAHQWRLLRRPPENSSVGKVSLPEYNPFELHGGILVDMRCIPDHETIMRDLRMKLGPHDQRTLMYKAAQDNCVKVIPDKNSTSPMSPSNDMPDLSDVFPEPEFGYG
jgi:hypothetical protein